PDVDEERAPHGQAPRLAEGRAPAEPVEVAAVAESLGGGEESLDPGVEVPAHGAAQGLEPHGGAAGELDHGLVDAPHPPAGDELLEPWSPARDADGPPR